MCASRGTRRADLIAEEIKRVHDEYGPASILVRARRPRRDEVRPCAARLPDAACSTSSALTRCRRANPTAGKAGTGAPSTSGAWTRSASRTRCRTTSSRTSPRTATRCCSGAATWRRPRLGWGGYLASRLCFWFTELGIKQIHIAPDVNYTNAVHADKWIPVHARTPTPRCSWPSPTRGSTEGTYDQRVPGHPRGRLRELQVLRDGRRGRRAEDPQVGREDLRRALLHHQGARPLLGQARRVHRALQRRLLHPVLLTRTSRRAWKWRSWACRALGKPGANQFKFIEWTLFGMESRDAAAAVDRDPRTAAPPTAAGSAASRRASSPRP